MTDSLSTEECRELLITAAGNAFDADSAEPNLRLLFTPATHRLALDSDVTLVRGARGTGKTVWFKVLNDERLRGIAAAAYMMPWLRSATATTGFGTATAPDRYPSPGVIQKLLKDEADPVEIWHAVVLVALGVPEVIAIEKWADKVSWAADNPEEYDRALFEHDRAEGDRNGTKLILFDALDHLHSDRKVADTLVSALLRVALELRLRTRRIRAKIFIRPDMYHSAPKNFPDASKIGANPADLTWTTEGLYGLLFHQLGNVEGQDAARFRASTGRWQDEGDGRFVAPVEAIANKERQEEIFVGIAGPYMGTTKQKGYTYTWLPNHLQDGNREVSPRSFLKAVSKAAEVTRDTYAGHEFALHHDGIRQGVQEASKVRADEITEDIPWAAEAIKTLNGLQVPIEESAVLRCWREHQLTATLNELGGVDDHRSGPLDTSDHLGLIDQLVELGVMTRRTAHRLDLPDVYRIAFGVGRKGGVPRRAT
ncbi:hypothetical protein ABZW03_10565 [Kitasatospora sp. NPDC004799]|uniref:hypothetical protein n=1 Tax=Kitasatospora sp. NPDC004799 TaxID=3154460 RepID=UPI0033A15B28